MVESRGSRESSDGTGRINIGIRKGVMRQESNRCGGSEVGLEGGSTDN